MAFNSGFVCGFFFGYGLILIGVWWLILVVLVVPVVAMGFDLEVGLEFCKVFWVWMLLSGFLHLDFYYYYSFVIL